MTDDPHPPNEADDQAPSELERRFQRLLRAYPRWYRRHRGDELLGTLLDSCGEEQEQPTRRQRADVIRSGLRTRLRIRGGAANVYVAVFLAIAGAVIGSWAGARLGWIGQPDPPGRAETADIAATALGGMKPDTVDVDDGPFAYGLEYSTQTQGDVARWTEVTFLGGDTYRRARQVAYFEKSISAGEWDRGIAHVAGNLKAAGWRVNQDNLDELPDGTASYDATALRDGLVLEVNATKEGGDYTWIEITVVRTVPAAQSAGLIAGAVAGLVAGWLFAVWIAWRLTVVHPGRRKVVARLFMVAGPFALGVLGAALGATVETLRAAPSDILRPPWYPLMDLPLRPLCWIVGALGVWAIVLAFWPDRHSDPVPQRPSDREPSLT